MSAFKRSFVKTAFLFAFISFHLPSVCQELSKQALMEKFIRLKKAVHEIQVERPDSALELVIEAERLAKELRIDSMIARAGGMKAEVYNRLRFTDMAIKEYYKVLKMAEEQKSLQFQQYALKGLGVAYSDIKEFKQSDAFLRKAIAKAKELGKNLQDTLELNHRLAINMVYEGNAKEAFPLLDKTLTELKKTGDADATYGCIDDYARALDRSKQPEKAFAMEQTKLEYPKLLQSIGYKENYFLHSAVYLYNMFDSKRARVFVDSAMKYAQLMGTKYEISACLEQQAIIYEDLGMIQEALDAYYEFNTIRKELQSKDYVMKMAAMSTLYDLETKQADIERLENENRIKQIQRNWIITAAAFLIVLVIVILGYRSQRQKRKMQVSFSRQLLQNQETENQRISKELHDSVGQNILFVKTQLKQHPQAEELKNVLTTIDSTIEEVRNISKDLYPNQLEKYGLAEAVETLGQLVKESTGIFVSADFGGLEQKLSKEEAINFYRIIQECINNSIKHSEATSIRITAEEKNKQIVLLIQDNGKGFDSAVLRNKASTSFGMLNMEERIKLLNGHFEIESTIGKGTKLCFTVPLS